MVDDVQQKLSDSGSSFRRGMLWAAAVSIPIWVVAIAIWRAVQ